MNPLGLPPVGEPPPPPWREVFGRDAPLEVDVGFGKGLFLTDRAREAPNVNVVGIEQRLKWVLATRGRIERERLPNASVMDGEAVYRITRSFQPGEVSRFYVFFPDPWWKRRHQRRRLWTPAFAALLTERLCPGGILYAQTDVAEYSQQILQILENAPGLQNASGPRQLAAWQGEIPPSPRERTYLQNGMPYYQMKYVRLG